MGDTTKTSSCISCSLLLYGPSRVGRSANCARILGTLGPSRRALPTRETSPPYHALHRTLAPGPSSRGLSRLSYSPPSRTPATLVPTGPRRLPNRLVRTTSLSLARPAQARDLGTPNALPPFPTRVPLSCLARTRSRVGFPPAWHAAPAILDFSQDDHDDHTWPRDSRLANPNAVPSCSTLTRAQLLCCNTTWTSS